MTEKPILFSGPMVRALLDGRKTQTRRVFKPERMTFDANGRYTTHAVRGGELVMTGSGPFLPANWLHYCPYGQPGDQLWVRETFSGPHIMEKSEDFPAMPPSQWPKESPIWYWADGQPTYGDWTRPRPSIHMPRAVSRITLEITGVRVERLQDISEGDAKAEGAEALPVETGQYDGAGNPIEQGSYRYGFKEIWTSIHGKDAWERNDWVAAYTFRRAKS